jgi:hypothetical protein
MHVLLFLGGLLSLAGGGAALGFGVIEQRLGITSVLLTPGVIGVIGGLVLLGLGTILLRLSRLNEILETQPVPRSIAVPTQDEALREAALVAEVVAISSPSAGASEKTSDAPRRKAAPPVTIDPPMSTRTEAPPAAAPPVLPPATMPAASMPAASTLAPSPGSMPVTAPLEQMTAPPVAPPSASVAAPVVHPHAPQIQVAPREIVTHDEAPRALKSGVIEGMAYTLYSNGTVDAELPRHGTVRFASIAQWRAYMRAEP